MPLVIDTFSDYFFYLQYRRRCVPHTIKANQLALRYFASLYGEMDTTKLNATHMVRFFEQLSNTRRLQKSPNGEYEPLSKYSIYKIMVKLRAYVRRLESEKLLWDLKEIDVPVGNVPTPIPRYLTKDEIKQIFSHLDARVEEVNKDGTKCNRYNAYLHRAVIRFLYTTWLRNAELRTLQMHDVNLDELVWAVLWKGNKYAAITFSAAARDYVVEYHKVRSKMFPWVQFNYVFTPYTEDSARCYTEQSFNSMVKEIAKAAGVTSKANAHIYRHTLATHLIQSGHSIVHVRDKLRHSSISITNQYTHSNPVDQMKITQDIDAMRQ